MHTLPTVKTEDMSMIKLYVYDQTIRTKQSFLASKRYYNKAIL